METWHGSSPCEAAGAMFETALSSAKTASFQWREKGGQGLSVGERVERWNESKRVAKTELVRKGPEASFATPGGTPGGCWRPRDLLHTLGVSHNLDLLRRSYMVDR